MLSEILRNKVVHKGVQAAIETCEAQRGDVEAVQVVCSFTQEEAIVYQQHDVTRSEADQEHDQHCDD